MNDLKLEILDFIKRRFKNDSNWLNGNCYYFGIILCNRFPCAKLYYDVILGHFLVQIDNHYYDWSGEIFIQDFDNLILWEKFEEYDNILYNRIIRDCIL